MWANNGVTIFILCLIAYQANAISFYLDPNGVKCLRDQVQAHQLIVMEFEITDVPGQQIDYVVRIFVQFLWQMLQFLNNKKRSTVLIMLPFWSHNLLVFF